MKEGEEEIVKGFGGGVTYITHSGMLEGVLKCYTFEDCDINILSFGELADRYNITYVKSKNIFIVHTGEQDLVFEKVNGQYCTNMLDWKDRSHNIYNIVTEREKLYTRKELDRARAARLFQKNAGYLSYDRAVRMIEGGQIEGMDLNKQDLDIAYDIYGPVVQEVRGKLTSRKVRSYAKVVMDKVHVEKHQNMVMDIFYVKDVKFLLAVMLPMGISFIRKLDSRSSDEVCGVVSDLLSMVNDRGYEIRMITTDGEPAFKTLINRIPGVVMNIGGSGDHVVNADIRIRRIKDICRAVLDGVPYKVPTFMLEYLVNFAVSRYNLQQNNIHEDCPRVKFGGWRPKFKKELSLCWGDYVEVYNPNVISNSVLQPRSEPCVALYPAGNTHGSWYFFNLNTNRVVMRSNWKRMFFDTDFINRMNNLCKEAIAADDFNMEDITNTAELPDKEKLEENENISKGEINSDIEVTESDDNVRLIDLADMGRNVGGNEDDTLLVDYAADLELEVNLEPIQPTRRSARANITKPPGFYDLNKSSHSVLHLSLKKGLEKYGELAVSGINAELQQMIDKKVWSYISSYHGSYLRSCMFLKEKLDINGMVYKVKARLVADGSTQILQPYEFTFTPTIKSSSIMCLLKIAAAEKRRVRCIDISGAYLHANMEGEVYMMLDKFMVEHLVQLDEECSKYRRDNGSVLVKLEKALYGCKNSGLLWYERLTSYLKKLKFVQNPHDDCVFNVNRNGVQITIGLHVDDLLITTESDDNYNWLAKMLKTEFGELTEQIEDKVNYLGMILENSKDGIRISMDTMVNDILEGVTGKATSPALEDLFEIHESELLGEADREYFHSTVAKLLYLSGKDKK